MAAIYLFDRESGLVPDGAADLLPPWRRRLWEQRRNENSRYESLCAGLLYACAMRRSGEDPDAEVSFLAQGKPVLSGREDCFFSLSHSGRYVICAVGRRPLGADVQKIRPVNLSISRRFHPAEQAWLETLPESGRAEAFFRIWTRKEAWVKAVSAERVLSLDEADVISGPAGLHFRDYSLPGGYAASVCAEEEELPESPDEVSVGELLGGNG